MEENQEDELNEEMLEKYIGGVEETDEILNRGSKRETKDFNAVGEKWEVHKKRIRKIAYTGISGKAVLNVYRESVVRDPEIITPPTHKNYTNSWGTARVVFEALELPCRLYMHVEWDK